MELVKSPKTSLCCYCKSWKLLTEDGETGWCSMKETWMNWKSTCEKYAEDKIC